MENLLLVFLQKYQPDVKSLSGNLGFKLNFLTKMEIMVLMKITEKLIYLGSKLFKLINVK